MEHESDINYLKAVLFT